MTKSSVGIIRNVENFTRINLIGLTHVPNGTADIHYVDGIVVHIRMPQQLQGFANVAIDGAENKPRSYKCNKIIFKRDNIFKTVKIKFPLLNPTRSAFP